MKKIERFEPYDIDRGNITQNDCYWKVQELIDWQHEMVDKTEHTEKGGLLLADALEDLTNLVEKLEARVRELELRNEVQDQIADGLKGTDWLVRSRLKPQHRRN